MRQFCGMRATSCMCGLFVRGASFPLCAAGMGILTSTICPSIRMSISLLSIEQKRIQSMENDWEKRVDKHIKR